MMRRVKADLHIHTVLSPCGDLRMSPCRIIEEAKKKGLDIIGITDHNTTLQAPEIIRLGQEAGLLVIGGAEVTSREEVHCLALFETLELLQDFQKCLDYYRLHIPNDVNRFGYQVVVNASEEIVYEEPWLLHAAVEQSLDQVADHVHTLGGLFIPAHIDRPRYSLISQLGFIPQGMKADAYEITPLCKKDDFLEKHTVLNNFALIHSSDAHYLNQIGTNWTELLVDDCTFSELRKALHGKDGRKVLKP